MEINKVNTPKVVGTELKKQSAKVKDTGLKDDKFEKSLTPDVVMDTLSNLKETDGKTNKYRYPQVLEGIKKSLEEDPKKCEFAQKLAPQKNISQLGLRNILALPYDTVKDITNIATKKDKKDELKFSTTSEVEDVYHMEPKDIKRITQLIDTPLTGKNIIKAVQEPTKIDTKKLAGKVNDVVKTLGEDGLKEVTFVRDEYSKGDYTLVAVKKGVVNDDDFTKAVVKNNDITVKEVMDSKLNRYALESLTHYKSQNGKEYQIKKVNDLRNNTTAKTRYELDKKGRSLVTHEVRLVKDKKGKVQRTEYTEPSDVKGIFNIKHVMANGEVKEISSAKVDKKTGITTIKKDMTSPLGVRTQYLYEDDPQGNRIVDYKITDKKGKVLLNNSESFEIVNDKKFISSKNGHEYEISIPEKGYGISVKDLENPKRTAKFELFDDISGMQEPILNVLKQMPGEELFKLKQSTNKLVGIPDVLSSYSQTTEAERKIVTGNDLFVILHELGHACDVKDVDMQKEKETVGKALFNDKKFNEIYEKEKKAFNKAYPDAQRNHIAYFINHETHYNGEIGGKKETIAESNALLTTAKTHEVLVPRPLKLSQISWEAPEIVLKTPVYNKYLIDVGKNLKINLQNQFIEINETVYQTKFQLQILIDTNGTVADVKILQASGNENVDNLIVSTTKQTLNYIKPPVVDSIKDPQILILEFEF